MTAGPCPPIEALRRLGDESIEGDTFRGLEAHVSRCPDCQGRLDQLARLDDLDTATSIADPDALPPAPPPPPAIPGLVLGGELGRGGCGVVFEAEQPRIGRRVAVKLLNAGPGLDDSSRRRWLREARAMGRVRHPNVARLHEAGEHEGRLYLVLDLIPGGNLRDRASGPIPPREAARLVEAVARAVEAIHLEGLLHLDIKPSNILLDGPPRADWPDLTPVLSDFGIALDGEAAADLSASGSLGLGGTPAFMAPEQVAGLRGSIGPPADVFALGATLYTLLAGRPPFQAASAIETIDLIRSRDPAAPSDLVPGTPRDLETICLHALRKDPGRRYGSAAELADDLRRWLDGFPIRARPVSNLGQAARWCRRHPASATLAGLLGGTILASLVGLTALWRRAEDQRDQARLALDRALDSEAAADLAVGDLLKLLESRMDEPHRGFRDRVEEVIPVLLDLTDQLRRNPRLSASHAASIAQLEMRVSDTLRAKGQNDRIFPIIEDAVELLRSAIERRPHDGKLAASYAKIRINGDLLRSESRPLEAPIEHFRHLAGILEPFAGAPGTISALASLQGYGMILASRLDEQGKAEVARALRDEVSEAFQRFRRDHPESWSISLLADLVRPGGPSRGPSSSMELVRSALRQAPEGLEIPEEMKAQLGVLIAKQLCDEHATGDAFRLDPEVVASRLLEALDDQFDGDEADRGLWFDILDQVSRMGSSQATRSRRAERIEETRWAIGWMFALGRALERRDPGDPGAHIVISRAFEQEHKLAWHLDDRDALEPALLGALTEATRVLALIPQNTLNRDHVAALREKYIRLVTQEPDPPGDESATRRSGRPAVQADPIPGDPEPSRPAVHSREVAVGGATRPEGRPVTPGAAGW